MDLQLLATMALIHCVALISPGPDFALMIKVATQHNRSTAIATAFGIALAIMVHTILSLTGISLIIHNSEVLYTLVQLLGASYLGWMGIGALRSAFAHSPSKRVSNDQTQKGFSSDLAELNLSTLSVWSGFRKGLYTNLLNPKALVFFVTLFSALITPSATLPTKIASASLLFSLSMAWFGLLAIVLSNRHIQTKFQQFSKLVDGITGLIFIVVSSLILYQWIFF